MPDLLENLDSYRAEAVEQWTDERVVPASWVEVHIWFFHHLYADLAQLGLSMQGYSVREGDDDCLLVLKLRREGTPYVVFIGSSDATHCMRKLRKRMRGGDLELRQDKYR